MAAEQDRWHKLGAAARALAECVEPALVQVETCEGLTRMCSCVVTLADAASEFAAARAAAAALGCSRWPSVKL